MVQIKGLACTIQAPKNQEPRHPGTQAPRHSSTKAPEVPRHPRHLGVGTQAEEAAGHSEILNLHKDGIENTKYFKGFLGCLRASWFFWVHGHPRAVVASTIYAVLRSRGRYRPGEPTDVWEKSPAHPGAVQGSQREGRGEMRRKDEDAAANAEERRGSEQFCNVLPSVACRKSAGPPKASPRFSYPGVYTHI